VIATTAPSDLSPVTWDDVLSPHVYVFYASFIVAFIFTPIMRSIAMYYGIIDQPDSVRKLHSAPVAYLGGVAVFMGWLAGLAISQLHIPADSIGSPHLEVKLSIVFGAIVIIVLGLWDDIKRIAPSNKILGQAIAAIILLKGGVGTDFLGPLVSPINARLHNAGLGNGIPEPITLFVSWVSVVCIVVGCCNATNLMDGLDGLCGGVTAVIAAGFLFLAVVLATKQLDPSWDPVRIVLALALLGAVLGFVPFNFNPASIFMGDTGSMFLGYSCATLIVLLGQEQSKWFLAAIVMFALPVMDTALAFIRRWVNKRPLFSADRHHFHHQMLARGFSIKVTVLISYALAIGFCVLGGLIAIMRTRYAVAFYLVIFGSIIVAAYKMGLVHEKVRVVSPKPIGPSNATAASTHAVEVVEIISTPKLPHPTLRPPTASGQPDPA
jgi:UDP-GlcNAc:undecaprenyl-phosphate/decaprenyl-phosphate GlcNAc-1-phosphate transferase